MQRPNIMVVEDDDDGRDYLDHLLSGQGHEVAAFSNGEDALKAVAQDGFPWLPVAAFFSHEIDAAGALSKVETPVAIFAAAHDQIIPAARTEALRKQVPNLVVDETISGADHNSIYARSQFQLDMAAALDRLIS